MATKKFDLYYYIDKAIKELEDKPKKLNSQ